MVPNYFMKLAVQSSALQQCMTEKFMTLSLDKSKVLQYTYIQHKFILQVIIKVNLKY